MSADIERTVRVFNEAVYTLGTVLEAIDRKLSDIEVRLDDLEEDAKARGESGSAG